MFIGYRCPDTGRYERLSKINEEILIGEGSYPPNSNQFRDVIYPKDYRWLIGFEMNPSQPSTMIFRGLQA